MASPAYLDEYNFLFTISTDKPKKVHSAVFSFSNLMKNEIFQMIVWSDENSKITNIIQCQNDEEWNITNDCLD